MCAWVQVLADARRGRQIPGVGVWRWLWAAQLGFWGLNSGLLQELQGSELLSQLSSSLKKKNSGVTIIKLQSKYAPPPGKLWSSTQLWVLAASVALNFFQFNQCVWEITYMKFPRREFSQSGGIKSSFQRSVTDSRRRQRPSLLRRRKGILQWWMRQLWAMVWTPGVCSERVSTSCPYVWNARSDAGLAVWIVDGRCLRSRFRQALTGGAKELADGPALKNNCTWSEGLLRNSCRGRWLGWHRSCCDGLGLRGI